MHFRVLGLGLGLLWSCANVLGTQDLDDCTGGCGGETGSTARGTGTGQPTGQTASSQTTATAATSGASTGACMPSTFLVSMQLPPDVRVDATFLGGDKEFVSPDSPAGCLPAGPVSLAARTNGGGNDPVPVTWGNEACAPTSKCSCDVTLVADAAFHVQKIGEPMRTCPP